MEMTTPQRVDVETALAEVIRLADVADQLSGDYHEGNRAEADLEWAAVNFVREHAKHIAALLQQLAELERDNETMRGADYHQAGVEQEQEIIDLESKLAERDAEIERLMTIAGWGGVSANAPERLILASEMYDDIACCDRWVDVRRVTDNEQPIPQTATAYVRADRYEAAERAREGDRAELAKFERECRIYQGQHERAYADHQMDGRESYHPGRALANTFKWMGDRIAAFLAANGGQDHG